MKVYKIKLMIKIYMIYIVITTGEKYITFYKSGF